MASKARKLEKAKEKYVGLLNNHKKLRWKAVWGLIGISLACACFVAIGIYSNDYIVVGCAGTFLLPLGLDIYYIVRCNKNVSKYNELAAEVEAKQEVWAEKLKSMS